MAAAQPGPAWLEFVQSGTAAVCATVIVNPADVMKTRLQLQDRAGGQPAYTGLADAAWLTWRAEGVKGLWRGLAAASLLQFSNVACRFGFYDLGKRAVLIPGEDARSAHAKSMAVGAGSGLIAAIVSNPFFLLKTRFQAGGTGAPGAGAGHQHNYDSLAKAARGIYADEGFSGFQRGLPAFAARVVVASSVQLSTYDSIKGSLVQGAGLRADRAMTHFAASLVTGAVVVAAMQPFDYACTVMMNEPPAPHGRFRHVGEVLMQTLRREGVAAVYSGALANYCRFGPYCCLVFLFLEQFRNLSASLLTAGGREAPQPYPVMPSSVDSRGAVAPR